MQRLVLRLLTTLGNTLHGGLQRVGTDGSHHATASQFGSQQLSVLSFLLRLLHNLHQHVILRPRQVFLLCLFSLFPECRICLSL